MRFWPTSDFLLKIRSVEFAIFTQGMPMLVSAVFSTWAVLPSASSIDHEIDAAFSVSSTSGWMGLEVSARSRLQMPYRFLASKRHHSHRCLSLANVKGKSKRWQRWVICHTYQESWYGSPHGTRLFRLFSGIQRGPNPNVDHKRTTSPHPKSTCPPNIPDR